MPAYNPGVADQSGMLLYEGLSGAGRSIGAGLDRLNEHRQKQIDEDKHNADLFKSLVQVADLTGVVSKDKALTMDLPTLRGVLEGSAAKKVQAQQELQTSINQAQLQTLRDAAAQRAAAPKFYGNIAGQMQPAPLRDPALAFKQRPVDLDMILRASRDTGYSLPPAELDNLIRATATKPNDKIPISDLGKPVPIPGLEGHYFIPTSTGGGEIKTAEGATVKPAPVEHDGQVVGFMLGKEFLTKDQLLGTAGFTAAKDERGRVIPNLYLNNKTGKEVKMTPDIITQLLNGGTAPAAGGKPNAKDPLGLFN